MLIISVKAGLGNQMFQYAMGQEIKRQGYSGDIKYDISWYNLDDGHTGYSLKKYFSIEADMATKKQCKALYPYGIYKENYSTLPKISRKLLKIYYFIRNIVYRVSDKVSKKKCNTILISEPAYAYDKSLFHLNAAQDIYLIGYFQNMNYFQKANLKQLFRFARPLPEEDMEIARMMEESDSVSVHVRRGDYTWVAGFDLCSIEYYKKAIELISDKNNVKYFLFTDDAEYIKKYFTFLGEYVICAHSVEDCDFDMQLMAKCKHHIMANSSFAFWGAYLSDSSGGVTVAPKYWYNDGQRLHEFSLPRDWIIIDNCCLDKAY